jgi:hypothetical protein
MEDLPPSASEQGMDKSTGDPSEESISTKGHRDFYIALFAAGLGYTRYSAALGGGLMLGGSFETIGTGLSLLFAQDAEKFITMEALAHLRLYMLFLSDAKNSTGLFIQAEGGVALFVHSEPENTTTMFTAAAGLCAGWRIPLGARWYIEPAIRGGFPYIFGGSLAAGYRF